MILQTLTRTTSRFCIGLVPQTNQTVNLPASSTHKQDFTTYFFLFIPLPIFSQSDSLYVPCRIFAQIFGPKMGKSPSVDRRTKLGGPVCVKAQISVVINTPVLLIRNTWLHKVPGRPCLPNNQQQPHKLNPHLRNPCWESFWNSPTTAPTQAVFKTQLRCQVPAPAGFLHVGSSCLEPQEHPSLLGTGKVPLLLGSS